MNVFEHDTEDEIKKLILSSSSKSCDLDPIPTSVLKKCLDNINNSHHWLRFQWKLVQFLKISKKFM